MGLVDWGVETKRWGARGAGFIAREQEEMLVDSFRPNRIGIQGVGGREFSALYSRKNKTRWLGRYKRESNNRMKSRTVDRNYEEHAGLRGCSSNSS